MRCDESCRIVDAAPREKVLKIRVSLPLDINDEFDGGVGVGYANFEARVVNDFALGERGVLAAGEFSGEFCGRCVFFDACVAVGGCSVEAHCDDVFDVEMCKFIGASDEDVCQNALIRENVLHFGVVVIAQLLNCRAFLGVHRCLLANIVVVNARCIIVGRSE